MLNEWPVLECRVVHIRVISLIRGICISFLARPAIVDRQGAGQLVQSFMAVVVVGPLQGFVH
jgi:hypothetical protein